MLQVQFQEFSRSLKLIMYSLKCKWQSSFSVTLLAFLQVLLQPLVPVWFPFLDPIEGPDVLGSPSLEPELGPEATIGPSSGCKGWLGTSNLVSGEILDILLGNCFGRLRLVCWFMCWLCVFLATFFVCVWTMFTVTCRTCNFFWLKAVHRFPTWSRKSHNVKNWMIGCTDR